MKRSVAEKMGIKENSKAIFVNSGQSHCQFSITTDFISSNAPETG